MEISAEIPRECRHESSFFIPPGPPSSPQSPSSSLRLGGLFWFWFWFRFRFWFWFRFKFRFRFRSWRTLSGPGSEFGRGGCTDDASGSPQSEPGRHARAGRRPCARRRWQRDRGRRRSDQGRTHQRGGGPRAWPITARRYRHSGPSRQAPDAWLDRGRHSAWPGRNRSGVQYPR
ncbi:MAG TPA: hypothetical protein ENJ18_11570 [Nannocystis exedens]|nr:hypothetical protein [Nannocystis exedens]